MLDRGCNVRWDPRVRAAIPGGTSHVVADSVPSSRSACRLVEQRCHAIRIASSRDLFAPAGRCCRNEFTADSRCRRATLAQGEVFATGSVACRRGTGRSPSTPEYVGAAGGSAIHSRIDGRRAVQPIGRPGAQPIESHSFRSGSSAFPFGCGSSQLPDSTGILRSQGACYGAPGSECDLASAKRGCGSRVPVHHVGRASRLAGCQRSAASGNQLERTTQLDRPRDHSRDGSRSRCQSACQRGGSAVATGHTSWSRPIRSGTVASTRFARSPDAIASRSVAADYRGARWGQSWTDFAAHAAAPASGRAPGAAATFGWRCRSQSIPCSARSDCRFALGGFAFGSRTVEGAGVRARRSSTGATVSQ